MNSLLLYIPDKITDFISCDAFEISHIWLENTTGVAFFLACLTLTEYRYGQSTDQRWIDSNQTTDCHCRLLEEIVHWTLLQEQYVYWKEIEADDLIWRIMGYC